MHHQLLFSEMRIALDHEQIDGLVVASVRDTLHPGFQNSRMGNCSLLNLVWVNLEARYNNNILFAVNTLDEPVFPHVAHIASKKPSICPDDVGGLVRSIPITFHDLSSADADFPHLANWQVVSVVVSNSYVGGRNRHANHSRRALHGGWCALQQS